MNIKVSKGRIIESFSVLPTVNVHWMRTEDKTYYDVQFAWLFWYVTVGQLSKFLETQGY